MDKNDSEGIEISEGESFWSWFCIALIVVAIAWGLVSCFKIRCETDIQLKKLEIQSQLYKQNKEEK